MPILLQLEDGATGLFPQAVLRDEANVNVAASPIDLVHVTEGLYAPSSAIAMPAGVEFVNATYITYTDAGHTTESTTNQRAHDVFVRADAAITTAAIADAVWEELLTDHSTTVGSVAEAMFIIKGLMHENYMLDNTTYDANGFMTAGRIRIFSTAGAVTAATDGGSGEGETHTFTIGGVAETTPNTQPATVKITR